MPQASFSLSDPHYDFADAESQQMLQAITRKQGIGLSACEYAIIFSPILPAGTVEEMLIYVPHAFAYLHEHRFDYEIQDPMRAGMSDFWENICQWAHRHKDELKALGQYDSVQQRALQFVEELLTFEWELSQEVGLLYYVNQLLCDTLELELLLEADAHLRHKVLGAFSSESERDCAMSLAFCDNCLQSEQTRQVQTQLYTPEFLSTRWLALHEQLKKKGEISSKHYARSIADLLSSCEPYL